jgi:hypothetical protein
MSESSARVDSIDEAEVHRTILWLQLEQPAYWASQLRKRQEALVRANEALRAKTMFRDASGRTPDTTQEQKAVQIAKRRIEEAEQKIAAVKKYRGRLEKEFQNYKGGVQRFSSAVASDIPRAVERLARVFAQLDAYVALAAPDAAAASEAFADASSSEGELRDGEASMARPMSEDAKSTASEEQDKPQEKQAS